MKILECGSGRDVRVGIAYLRVASVPAYVAYVFLYLLLFVFNSIFSRGIAYPMEYNVLQGARHAVPLHYTLNPIGRFSAAIRDVMGVQGIE
ncbi:MAG: hypothetical protein U9Q76_00620, partial [candidate division WOR-3 bacterium]|nr:hypothetical protein [candidate division WOR-3 bacterium]